MLKIQSEMKEETELNYGIHRFYDLDAIGTAEKEVSVYDECKGNITFENIRYTVKLTFKENNPVLQDNYGLSKKRLLSWHFVNPPSTAPM